MKGLISDKVQYGFLNKNNKYVHVGYGTDDNYLKYVISSIRSLLEHNLNINFCFHIVVDKQKDIEFKKIEKIIYKTKHVCFLYVIPEGLFSELITLKFYNKAIYYRYFLPYIVDTNDYVFYFDSDVLCVNNAELFFNDIDLKDKAIAAVIDISKNVKERVSKLNLSSRKYFNSGVLVFNTVKWRESGLIHSLCEYIKINGSMLRFPDQDALNVVLENDVLFINKKYNCIYALKVNKKDVVFLHLANQPKPWSNLWKFNPMCIKWVDEEVSKYFVDKNRDKVCIIDYLKWITKKIMYPFLQGREQQDYHEEKCFIDK